MSVSTVTTTLSPILLQSFKTADSDRTFLLIKEIEEKKLLYKLLLIYEYGKGNLNNISFLKDTLEFSGPLRGNLKAAYDISEYSLCAAIDYTATYQMQIDFEINIEEETLHLSGEDRRERQDEF